MKFDGKKIKKGYPYPIKDNYVKLANGTVYLTTEGITSLPYLKPYKDYGVSNTEIPYTYNDHKNAIDLRAKVGTPVYAVKDITIGSYGTDDFGNYVYIGSFRFRHMDKLPTKKNFKAGEVIFYTGCNATSQPHLHVGNDYEDCFVDAIEGKSTSYTKVKAVRSGKSNYNGTYYFDLKHYDVLKDLYQEVDLVDLSGSTWYATTSWTSVTKV